MEQRLEVAAREGNIDAFYSLMKEDAYLLERIEGKPFIDTPLHIAASAGQGHFAMEILRWKPSFAKKPNQEGLCPIHLATKNRHIETLKQILSFDRGLARLKGREGKTSLHYAAEEGDTKLLGALLSACPPSIEDVTDRSDTALHIAIKHSKFDAFSFLLRGLQEAIHEGSMEQETKILNFQDEDGDIVLHIAVEMNLHEMEQRLEVAAREGNIDALYSLMKEDAYLLERIEKVPFIDTPLHIAASAGQVHFAMEIMRWKPSFAKKPNQEGLCPIHLATKKGHIETLKQILSFDRGLARLQGREGKTSLHYAAERGDTKLLGILLSACPPSMGDVTDRSDTALHIAIKHHKFDAFSFLLRRLQTAIHEGSIEQETKILNFQDENGNTVLHIAVEMNLHEVVELLIDSGVKVKVKNSADRTALDIAKGQGTTKIEEMLARASGSTCSLFRCIAAFANHCVYKSPGKLAKAVTFCSLFRCSAAFPDHCVNKSPGKSVKAVTSIIRYKRGISMESRDLLLAVSVLIATITYQTAVNPPKNPTRDDINNDRNLISCFLDNPITNFSSPNSTIFCAMHNRNTTSHRHGLFTAFSENAALFWTFNIFALYGSILAIVLLLPETYFSIFILMPLEFFVYCYMVTIGIVSSVAWFAITLLLFLMLLIMVFCINREVKRKDKDFDSSYSKTMNPLGQIEILKM